MPNLTPEELRAQMRSLWAECLGHSEAYLDAYFAEKYTDKATIARTEAGSLVAGAQLLPRRATLFGEVVHAGLLTGLATLPGHRRGHAAAIIREAHRRLWHERALVSYLVPADEAQRTFFEQQRHGAYWTTTYRRECRTEMPVTAGSVAAEEALEWGDELYVFYSRMTGHEPFALHPTEGDFFAALMLCDSRDGHVIVARRGHAVTGLCLAVRQEDGRARVLDLHAADAASHASLIRAVRKACATNDLYDLFPAGGNDEAAIPYAMARVVHVERFLRLVARTYPTLDMHIGIDGDLDIPENNGYYRLCDGRCTLTDEVPETIITPGGLAALFTAAQPTHLLLLPEEL